MKKNNRVLKSSLLFLSVASVLTGKVYAQTTASPDDGFSLEEIIVTAQKREQSLQDVPLAVSAFSGRELLQSGVIDTQDLESVNSSLVIRSSTDESRGSVLRIRGVGTTGNNSGLEGSVGVFVDGVYLSRTGIAMNNLVDIERVEVLRGPQGTLFGKNTSSGAIAIFTKKPDFENSGMLSVSYANNNDLKLKGSINGELMPDLLAGRLAFTSHTRDGHIDNVAPATLATSGDEYNDRDRQTLRGQLLLTPDDSVDVRLIVDHGEKDESCCASPYSEFGARQAAVNAAAITLGIATQEQMDAITSLSPFDRKVATDKAYSNVTEESGASIEVNWDFNGINLSSISGYRNYEFSVDLDGDRSLLDIANTKVNSEVETLSQEFRVNGVSGGLDWMLGAYLFSEEISELSSTLYGAHTGEFFSGFVGSAGAKALIRSSYVEGDGAVSNNFKQQTDGYSIFSHNNIDISDVMMLTFGLRYNTEEKEGSGVFVSNSTPLCSNPGPLGALGFICPVPDFRSNNDYSETTGTLKLSYSLNDSALTYLSYARGFKAGGINLNRAAGLSIVEFLPETVDTGELGVKAELLDGRLRLNTAVYYSEYENFQLNTFDGVTTIVSNAAGVRSHGAELDLTAKITRGLVATLSYAYNDTQYTGDTVDPVLAGEQLSAAPKSTATIGATYRRSVADNLLGFVNVNARYQTGSNTGSDLDPQKFQSDFMVANMRFGLRDKAGDWELAVWGKNITDEEYFAVVIDSPGQAGSYNAFVAAPASYGLAATYNF